MISSWRAKLFKENVVKGGLQARLLRPNEILFLSLCDATVCYPSVMLLYLHFHCMLTVVTVGRVRSYLLDSILHGVRNPHSIPTRIQGALGKGIVGEEGYQFQTCNDRSSVHKLRERGTRARICARIKAYFQRHGPVAIDWP